MGVRTIALARLTAVATVLGHDASLELVLLNIEEELILKLLAHHSFSLIKIILPPS